MTTLPPLPAPARRLLRRVLSHNMPMGRLWGYAAAQMLGLAIVMVAVQLWADVMHGHKEADSFLPDDYMIVQKRVEGLGGLLADPSAATFSEGEAAELTAQPWATAVGVFEAADFDVYASLDMGGRRLSTSLFLEAIPDSFIDGLPGGWEAPAGDGRAELPVIVSRDYLALYNFGYAPSHGMPQLSESMVRLVPLTLVLRSSDGTRERRIRARIAGFSSRLNTIAVPLEFMRQANAELGSGREVRPSRLIVKLSSPANPDAADWVAAKGYDTAGDRLDAGRLARVVAVVATAVAAIGLVITALALAVMVLSLRLMMERNKGRVGQLLLLGYAPRQITGFYMRRIALVNAAVMALAAALTVGAALLWRGALASAGIAGAPLWPAMATGAALLLLATALCLPALRSVR